MAPDETIILLFLLFSMVCKCDVMDTPKMLIPILMPNLVLQ